MQSKDHRSYANDHLGMSSGKAKNKLQKIIMFMLAQKCNRDICYRCGDKIIDIKDFTIDHKKPWRTDENATELYFSLDNIAFSHFKCNKAGM